MNDRKCNEDCGAPFRGGNCPAYFMGCHGVYLRKEDKMVEEKCNGWKNETTWLVYVDLFNTSKVYLDLVLEKTKRMNSGDAAQWLCEEYTRRAGSIDSAFWQSMVGKQLSKVHWQSLAEAVKNRALEQME